MRIYVLFLPASPILRDFLDIYICIFCLCVCTASMAGVPEGRKRMSDPLALD